MENFIGLTIKISGDFQHVAEGLANIASGPPVINRKTGTAYFTFVINAGDSMAAVIALHAKLASLGTKVLDSLYASVICWKDYPDKSSAQLGLKNEPPCLPQIYFRKNFPSYPPDF